MSVVIDKIRNTFNREYTENPIFTLFLAILLLFFVMFILAAIITGGESILSVLIKEDTFMDHFNSIMDSSDRPYSRGEVIYPPLATIFYIIIGNITIPFVDVTGDLTAGMLRDSQMGIMSLILLILVVFYALHLIYHRIMKVNDIKKELMFLFLILLSYPFLFAVERGNNILLALVFSFLFLLGYRSENRIIRYTSYFALGCAAGLKLYPAILALLIVRDRRYKEAAICMSIVAATVLLPFVFTDGNPIMLMDTIFSYTNTHPGSFNINQLSLAVFQDFFGFSHETGSIIGFTITSVFTILSFAVILFDRRMKFWKILALLSCNLVLGFGLGCPYQMIYMTMPILFFLVSEKEMTKENLFFTICFAMTMALIPGIIFHNNWMVTGCIESMFAIIIAIALIYEGLRRIFRDRSIDVDRVEQ